MMRRPYNYSFAPSIPWIWAELRRRNRSVQFQDNIELCYKSEARVAMRVPVSACVPYVSRQGLRRQARAYVPLLPKALNCSGSPWVEAHHDVIAKSLVMLTNCRLRTSMLRYEGGFTYGHRHTQCCKVSQRGKDMATSLAICSHSR